MALSTFYQQKFRIPLTLVRTVVKDNNFLIVCVSIISSSIRNGYQSINRYDQIKMIDYLFIEVFIGLPNVIKENVIHPNYKIKERLSRFIRKF